jgi:hypothetical protein
MTSKQREELRWLILAIACLAVAWLLSLASLRAEADGLRLTVSQDGLSVNLAWDPPADAATVRGYVVGVGTVSGTYPRLIDVGLVVTATVPVPTPASLTPYFFVVRSYDEAGVPSDWSNEASTGSGSAPPPPPPLSGGWPALVSVTFTSDPIAGTSTARLTWDPSLGVGPNAGAASGYKIYAGQSGSRVYSARNDVGLATSGTITVATPATPTTFYFAVTAYRIETTTFESGFSNELTAVIPAGASPPPQPPPPPPPPQDACLPPFGNRVVTATITRYVTTNKNAAGSLSRLEYLTTSPNSLISHVAVLLDGTAAAVMDGANVGPASGMWFTLPTVPGTYTVTLEASNAAGCKAVATKDASGKAITVVVK